jgi:histidinol-phosphate aminotransferase
LPLRPRPELEKLVPDRHGGPNQAELESLGLTPGGVIDFSVCSNPYAPPLELDTAAIPVNLYPDSESTELRRCLSAVLKVPAENILAGSGSMELIRLIALAYFSRGDTVLMLEPTFGEYRVAARIMGAEVVGQWAKEEDGFSHDIAETLSLIKTSRPRAVFICNPNNPTGRYLSRRQIESVLDASAETLLVLDEAYVNFVDGTWRSLDLIGWENLVIVRSMTKDHTIPGLRLGYAVAHREIIGALRLVRPPWNVNAVAQEVGKNIVSGNDCLENSRKEIGKAKKYLVDGLGRLGFEVVPSEANFFLFRVERAAEFRSALLKKGIMVRDCASFGLKDYVRIGVRTMTECRKLIEAIESLGSY